MDPRFCWKTVILVGAGFPVDQHTTEWLELMGVLNIGRLDQSICLRRSGSRLVSSPYGQPRSILEWCHSWRNLNQYQDDICFLFACLTWSRSYACTLSSSICFESQPAVGKKSPKKKPFLLGHYLNWYWDLRLNSVFLGFFDLLWIPSSERSNEAKTWLTFLRGHTLHFPNNLSR